MHLRVVPRNFTLCASALLLLMVQACGFSSNPEVIYPEGGFRVSVKSGGEVVEDFGSPLVFRRSLDQKKLVATCQNSDPIQSEIFKKIEDARGGLAGVEVLAQEKSAMFGWQAGDILTAIGRKYPALEGSDLKLLCDEFNAGHPSVTLLREGRHLKYIYVISEGSR